MQMFTIKYRIPRSPNIGDKFSSRHGQKGVLSQKWPATDMPFTESGMQPDIIINPHAFPSRMTIGMFVESLAGKSGALHGIAQDSTPFKFNEDNTAGDYFGKQLKAAGYNYHGNEPMYSGITGEELAADIYIGVVYYQRLRHMVNDKYQVRTTGKISELTHQPIKGRKKGGGIRVGEMERDSLLAHGSAFLLQDRLFNCSDYTQTSICRECGSFLSTMSTIRKMGFESRVRCRRCAEEATGFEDDGLIWEDGLGGRFVGGANTTIVAVPYVLKYLDVELAAMGIAMKFNVSP
jgi:DNA-directed RNA polymerase I subunit RPA2